MEHKTDKLVSVTDSITCDVCSVSCKREAQGGLGSCEYGTLHATWGYWSERDMMREECHLCETCFGKVRGFIKELGGRVREENLLCG